LTACLGGEQLAKQFDEARCEQIWRTCSLGDVFFGLDEVTARVNNTAKVHKLVSPGDTVVGIVAIRHQDCALPHAHEQLVGQFRTTPGRIGKAADRDSRARHL